MGAAWLEKPQVTGQYDRQIRRTAAVFLCKYDLNYPPPPPHWVLPLCNVSGKPVFPHSYWHYQHLRSPKKTLRVVNINGNSQQPSLPPPSQSCLPLYRFYPLFFSPPSSSISLFSTPLHWSPSLNWFWSYCRSLPPIPSPVPCLMTHGG